MAKQTLLRNLYVGEDLSVRREKLEIGRIKHMTSTIRGNFSPLFTTNLLFLLFALPIVVLMGFVFPNMEQSAVAGLNFSGNIGIGYPNVFDDPTLGKILIYDLRINFFAILIPCFTLVGVGAAGLFYCCRNLLWGASVKPFRHFFRGVKLYWHKYAIAFTVIGGLVAFCAFTVINNLKLMLTNSSNAGSWILMIFSLLLALVCFIFLIFYLPMTMCYRFKERHNIKNAMIFSVSLILTTVINIVLMGLPMLLMLNSFASTLLLMLLIMIGFSFYAMWIMSYAQFAFDSFIKVLFDIKQQEELRRVNEEKRRQKKKKQPQTNPRKKKK